MQKLTRSFYEQDTITVAQQILGKYLVHCVGGVERIGKIVEVEAYLGSHDLACHSSKGLTKRTEVMFGPAGHAYIYLIYGIHHCMNIVTEPQGNGSAVLIRAIEPIKNITGRTQGPGLLCKAMAIDKGLNGVDLTCEDFFIADCSDSESFSIIKKPRIGVDYAKQWAKKLLRFYINGNPFISRV